MKDRHYRNLPPTAPRCRSQVEGYASVSPRPRVVKLCRWIRSAVSVPLLRTTVPDITICSFTLPSSKTGQSMKSESWSPGASGLSAVKRRPALLTSIVCPEPDSAFLRRRMME